MGYGGYLVKFGDYIIPNSLIKQDTFSSYVNMQDKDPWTDENGFEHRDAVELKALKVEFETKAMLTEKQFDDFWKNIENKNVQTMPKTMFVKIPDKPTSTLPFLMLRKFSSSTGTGFAQTNPTNSKKKKPIK